MITFIDLYRKNYEEPIKDIKYEATNDDYRMILTYYFENVEITFESIETGDTKWIAISVEVITDDKKYFDNKYEFIKNAIKKIK